MTIKQVIVIRKDLNMRKGKIASQVAHASMKVFLDRSNIVADNSNLELRVPLNDDMVNWLIGSFTKIVVSVDSEEELKDVYIKSLENSIPCSIIKDNGDTEFGGVPTYTAVAIGPAKSELINEITGNLKLL